MFDFKLTIKTNIYFLKLLGLWPKNSYDFNWYTLYTLLLNAIIASDNIGQTANLFFVYVDFGSLMGTIFVLFTNWCASIKASFFIYNIRYLKTLMKKIDCEEFQPKTRHHENLVLPTLQLWKMIYYLFQILVGVTTMLITTYPVIDGSIRRLELPFWAWYPYNTRQSQLFQIVYFYQLFCVWCIAFTSMNIDMANTSLMMFVKAQCNLLCYNLKNLNNYNNCFNAKLLACIKHHKKILSFANIANTFSNEILLTQFFTSTVSLGLAMFQLSLFAPLSADSYILLFYIVAIIDEIFLYCWFGNEVEHAVSIFLNTRKNNSK
ncbi:odorant receptor 94a-like [Tribolium madens]|uniref:odorant receptor 94a-like n=1 Tax=Tribolium madens TaxID=41895 RepID=UPI001CF75F0F|nr:odorant receptor 94a-like [Tribolium madens]